MLEAYFVIATVIMICCIFGSVIMMIIWSIDGEEDRQTNARLVLKFLAGIPLAWTWPLTVPALFVYLMSRLVKDASLPRNPLR